MLCQLQLGNLQQQQAVSGGGIAAAATTTTAALMSLGGLKGCLTGMSDRGKGKQNGRLVVVVVVVALVVVVVGIVIIMVVDDSGGKEGVVDRSVGSRGTGYWCDIPLLGLNDSISLSLWLLLLLFEVYPPFLVLLLLLLCVMRTAFETGNVMVVVIVVVVVAMAVAVANTIPSMAFSEWNVCLIDRRWRLVFLVFFFFIFIIIEWHATSRNQRSGVGLIDSKDLSSSGGGGMLP
jgi:hypothetical protein